MVRIKSILLIVVVSLIFCSCTSSYEIEDLSFVNTIGIDKNPDGAGILVSVRIIDPGATSDTGSMDGGGDGSSGFHVLKASGETFYQAIYNLQVNSPHKLFFGHNKAIIFGKEYAESGIENVIDGIERNMELAGSNNMFISEQTALDTLSVELGSEGSKIDFIDTMQNAIKDYTIIAPIMRYKFTLELKSDNMTSYAPMVSIIKEKNDQQNKAVKPQNTLNLEKTGIIKDNKLITILSKEDTASLLWIKDRFTKDILLIPFESDKGKDILTIEVGNAKTKVTPKLTDEGLVIDIKFKGDAYLREVSYGNANIQDKKVMAQIEKLIEEKLKENVFNSINHAKYDVKCEYFGFAHALHNKLPDYWREINENWDEIFQVTPINIVYNIDLKGIGMINDPGMEIIDEGATK